MTTTRKAPLLSIGADAKTVKGEKLGIRTAILYLAPSTLSGRDLCPYATPACRAACLNTAGRGIFSSVQAARLRKAKAFLYDRKNFLADLHRELRNHERTSLRKGMEAYVRLNGTSDIPWEKIDPSLFTNYEQLVFYDYTKNAQRAMAYVDGKLPSNLHVTLSYSGENQADCYKVLEKGGQVAVVVAPWVHKALFGHDSIARYREAFYALVDAIGEPWAGGDRNSGMSWQFVDGDETDARPMDAPHPGGTLVILKAKGEARGSSSSFVIGSQLLHLSKWERLNVKR